MKVRLAAIYALRPHELGFCGAKNEAADGVLLSYAEGDNSQEQKVREILAQFPDLYDF
jgi:hypothetical protein